MNYYSYAYMPGEGLLGTIVKRNEIKVSINDLVMLRGYGAFDYMRTHYGVPFRINDYLDRFEASVKELKLKLPINRAKILSIINELLTKNGIGKNGKTIKDIGIRFLLTGGYTLDSYLPGTNPNFFILLEDIPQYPDWWSEKGIKLMLHEHNREMAHVKTINYITAITLADERRKKNAQDTLYAHNGKVLETARNNFFAFKHNTLITGETNILLGITRKVLLELIGDTMKIEKRSLYVHELKSCTECFVTGTNRGITPVVCIDDMKIGDGTPGKHTKALMKLFDTLVSTESKNVH